MPTDCWDCGKSTSEVFRDARGPPRCFGCWEGLNRRRYYAQNSEKIKHERRQAKHLREQREVVKAAGRKQKTLADY
jgi:DNA-directed RNA polymerase subunit N (RpoN/RPB10)